MISLMFLTLSYKKGKTRAKGRTIEKRASHVPHFSNHKPKFSVFLGVFISKLGDVSLNLSV